MREQLIQYVELLFAGARDCEDIKQEILQNTLDRYDDLIAEGKVPEAAYRLAITGIGDISEILGTKPHAAAPCHGPTARPEKQENDTPGKKLLRAIAVGLYILSPMPLIVLSEMGMDIIGLCGTLCIVAIATVMIMLGAKKDAPEDEKQSKPQISPEEDLKNSLDSMIWAIGLAVYLIFSFATSAWYITWLIFPITGAVKGLVRAIVDLKEAKKYET